MKEAIAVTSDGFETRHVLRRVDAEFIAAGSGFVVSFDREGEPPGVLGGDGSLRRVEIDEGEPRPLQEGRYSSGSPSDSGRTRMESASWPSTGKR